MNRKYTVYIILVAIVVGIIIFIDYARPKPIDWKPSYLSKDKIPFGLYVFNEEAATLFKGDSVAKFSITPYEYFDPKYDYDNSKYKIKGSFIAINETNTIDEESVKELLNFADYGNTVLLSMKSFPQTILDTLKIIPGGDQYFADSLQISLANNPSKSYWYNEGAGLTFFDSLPKNDSIRVLGYQQAGKVKKPNFIEARFGGGKILLHTQPAAFTNFHLLKGDHYKYTQDLVSYLPKGTIYWQNERVGQGVSDSPLRYIMSQPALRAAWQLGLIGLLVFIFFNAKRKQRVLPQIMPLRNTTVDFAKTIGNLYYQEGNHHTIIEKKIIYFLEHVRTEYLIDTYTLDDSFVEKLHLKTGKPVEEIQKTVSLINKHRHDFQSSEADVAAINNAIEKLRL